MDKPQIPQELLDRMKPKDYNKSSRSPYLNQFLSATPKELIDRVNNVVEEDELPSVAEKLNEYMEEKGLKKSDIGNKVSGYMGLSTFYRMVDTKATTEAGRKTQPTGCAPTRTGCISALSDSTAFSRRRSATWTRPSTSGGVSSAAVSACMEKRSPWRPHATLRRTALAQG